MTQTQTDYLKPFLTLVFLFFVVGFLTTANGQFQAPLQTAFLSQAGELKNTLATLITFSWFLAYPPAGRWGSHWVTTTGYKGTLLRGLCLMLAGLVVFLCSSWFTARYPALGITVNGAFLPAGFFIFLVGSFIVGASATVLQVVINPYLTACFVRGTQPIQRLAIGGTANAVGNTLAPYFVASVVFGNVAVSDIAVTQLTIPFIGEIAVMALVTIMAFNMALPDVEGTKARAGEQLSHSVWSFKHFRLGVIAIFCYVGVEVAVGANINLYVNEQLGQGIQYAFFGMQQPTLFGQPFTIPALMATLYWGGTLIGRLVGSTLRTITPRAQLLTVATSAITLAVLTLLFNNAWLLVGMGLAHSIMWGAIYTLATAHLGKYTSKATGTFMMGVLGGAIVPLLQGGLADLFHGWTYTWVLVVAGEAYILYYALRGYRCAPNIQEITAQ